MTFTTANEDAAILAYVSPEEAEQINESVRRAYEVLEAGEKGVPLAEVMAEAYAALAARRAERQQAYLIPGDKSPGYGSDAG